MSTLTPIAATFRGGHSPLGADARLVGKSSESAQMHGERHDNPQDKPRLTPLFVTQLLGQVMAGERHVIVRGAYGETGAAEARLLDTRL